MTGHAWCWCKRAYAMRSVLCAVFERCLPWRRYAAVDKGFNVTGYMWVAAWFLIFSVDQVYIKHIVDTIQVPRVGAVPRVGRGAQDRCGAQGRR